LKPLRVSANQLSGGRSPLRVTFDAEYCDADLYQVLYRDDGVVLGLVLRLRDGKNTDAYIYTAEYDALRRLGARWSDDAARRAVERAVGTEEGDSASRRKEPPAA
jgi:hypothetical protein